jgi:predicted MFS family arabinose efflux permease
VLVGATIPTSLYPTYQNRYGFSAGVRAIVFNLSDQVDRRRLVLSTLGLVAMGSAIFVLAQSVGWLFVARMLQGLGAGVTIDSEIASSPRFI